MIFCLWLGFLLCVITLDKKKHPLLYPLLLRIWLVGWNLRLRLVNFDFYCGFAGMDVSCDSILFNARVDSLVPYFSCFCIISVCVFLFVLLYGVMDLSLATSDE